MFDLDKWQEIYHTLKQNKLRTFLTAFGVFWGILMLILLLGAGTGMRHGAEQMFSSDVQDSLWIFGRRTSLPYQGLAPGRKIQFTEADLRAIKRQFPGVKHVSAENPLGSFFEGDIVVTHGKKSGNFSVFGTADDYFKIKVFQDYRFGRRLNTFDSDENRKVATIGTRVAEALFPEGEDPTGKYIAINGVAFKVVGVFYDKGWEGRMSERLYIPLEAFQKIFGHSEDINLIAVAPRAGVDGFALEQKILQLLRERHRVAAEDRRAIFSNNLAKGAQMINGLFMAINAFIWFVGIGTLMAGIVGISNIMIITVKERTREIGVRKALGASSFSIISLILMESVMITGVAGYLGLVMGVGLLEATSYVLETLAIDLPFFARPEVDFQVAVTALLLLVGIGTVAGLVPALQAARITPVAAMRAD